MTPQPRLYADLAAWWPVMSSPADYAEEAAAYRATLDRIAAAPIRDLLELGSGGGNNASHLKPHYRMTLVDLSAGMLAASRTLNPECEHVQGDMRSVRLGRTYDAVFVQDAILYMTTEADLHAALATAYAHVRPGGVALFVPDDTRETFRPATSCGGHDVGPRSFRYLEWQRDPDPAGTTFVSTFAYLLREGQEPARVEMDEHALGVFPRATWLRLLAQAGFEPLTLPATPNGKCELFAGRRPAAGP